MLVTSKRSRARVQATYSRWHIALISSWVGRIGMRMASRARATIVKWLRKFLGANQRKCRKMNILMSRADDSSGTSGNRLSIGCREMMSGSGRIVGRDQSESGGAFNRNQGAGWVGILTPMNTNEVIRHSHCYWA